jgi:hypothetical protein
MGKQSASAAVAGAWIIAIGTQDSTNTFNGEGSNAACSGLIALSVVAP